MKVPAPDFDATVAFYRDVLGLNVVEEGASGEDYRSVVFQFGPVRLWVDEAKDFARPEVWFEIVCDDEEVAADHLASAGAIRRDDAEPLPKGFPGFWIANPAGVIHLIARD